MKHLWYTITLTDVTEISLVDNKVKGERNQLMIWGFTEFRTNKKNESMTFLIKILQGAGVKARLYLINFKFPANLGGCHFSLICDVNPSIPIYLFS